MMTFKEFLAEGQGSEFEVAKSYADEIYTSLQAKEIIDANQAAEVLATEDFNDPQIAHWVGIILDAMAEKNYNYVMKFIQKKFSE